MTPNVRISNARAGDGGVVLVADCNVEVARNLVITIHRIRLVRSRTGGLFVAMPSRLTNHRFVDDVSYSGSGAEDLISAIREAMKREVTIRADRAAELEDRNAFGQP